MELDNGMELEETEKVENRHKQISLLEGGESIVDDCTKLIPPPHKALGNIPFTFQKGQSCV